MPVLYQYWPHSSHCHMAPLRAESPDEPCTLQRCGGGLCAGGGGLPDDHLVLLFLIFFFRSKSYHRTLAQCALPDELFLCQYRPQLQRQMVPYGYPAFSVMRCAGLKGSLAGHLCFGTGVGGR